MSESWLYDEHPAMFSAHPVLFMLLLVFRYQHLQDQGGHFVLLHLMEASRTRTRESQLQLRFSWSLCQCVHLHHRAAAAMTRSLCRLLPLY